MHDAIIRHQRLAGNVASIAGRWLLSLIFVVTAMQTIQDFRSTAADLAAKNMPLAATALGVALVVQIGGAISLITGIQRRWGALLLVLFLLAATFTYHSFWLYEGPRRDAQLIHFLKNLAIMGGLIVVIAETRKTRPDIPGARD